MKREYWIFSVHEIPYAFGLYVVIDESDGRQTTVSDRYGNTGFTFEEAEECLIACFEVQAFQLFNSLTYHPDRRRG
jgi:hypothetical protein